MSCRGGHQPHGVKLPVLLHTRILQASRTKSLLLPRSGKRQKDMPFSLASRRLEGVGKDDLMRWVCVGLPDALANSRSAGWHLAEKRSAELCSLIHSKPIQGPQAARTSISVTAQPIKLFSPPSRSDQIVIGRVAVTSRQQSPDRSRPLPQEAHPTSRRRYVLQAGRNFPAIISDPSTVQSRNPGLGTSQLNDNVCHLCWRSEYCHVGAFETPTSWLRSTLPSRRHMSQLPFREVWKRAETVLLFDCYDVEEARTESWIQGSITCLPGSALVSSFQWCS